VKGSAFLSERRNTSAPTHPLPIAYFHHPGVAWQPTCTTRSHGKRSHPYEGYFRDTCRMSTSECQLRDTKSVIHRSEGGFFCRDLWAHLRERRRCPRRFSVLDGIMSRPQQPKRPVLPLLGVAHSRAVDFR